MSPVSGGGSALKTVRRVRGLLAATLAVTVAGGSALSCGASIRSVYEGDVRFEHCMALDASADVKPTLRRGCWEEWVSFYTFGQTRDRIDYARARQQQLDGASDFAEAPARTPKLAVLPAVAPDPTSAIAPPPMMLAATDAGIPDAAGPLDEADERAAVHARCASECQQGLEACHQACKGPACGKACGARFVRCAARCEQRRQGSR